MTTHHVVSAWYFDAEVANEGMPCFRPVTLVGLKRATTNYLGSIAFGTLITAILEAIYYTAKYVADQMTGTNMILKMIVCCFLCILSCLKNTIEWLTSWAYAYIALYGVGFMSAGGKVFKMLADSGLSAIAQSTLVGPVLFMGRLIGGAIGVGAGFLTLETFTIEHEWSQPLIGFFIAFSITSVALSCVEAGNKSIFVCYGDSPEFLISRVPGIASELDGAQKKAKEAKTANGGLEQVDVDIVKP